MQFNVKLYDWIKLTEIKEFSMNENNNYFA